MKGTTNYQNTFIQIADDCPAENGETPPAKGDKKTVANLQFEMLFENPYKYTSDDVIFSVYAIRRDISENEWKEAREEFFSKGQPCLRTSPLTKRYGWGVHCDAAGKVALYGSETEAYEEYVKNGTLEKTKAMRSKRV